MNRKIGLLLVVYGLLLAGLSYFAHHLAPQVALPTLIAGLAGGLLCLLWGIGALTGWKGKALPILTLIPVSFVLLTQTFTSWLGGGGFKAGPSAAGTITLLLLLSLGMLLRIAWSGVLFDMPRSSANEGK